MLNYIFSSLKTIILVILFNEYLKTNYPIKHSECMIFICYNSLYFYSLLQIKYNKIKKIILYKIPELNKLNTKYADNNDNDINIILDGKIIKNINKDNIINKSVEEIQNLYNIQTYDFLIYSENSKKCILNFNLNGVFKEEDFICESSDFKFISSEIILKDKRINIDFKVNNHNYYLINNIFDAKFILFFMYEYYNEEVKYLDISEILEYKLEILDQNVNKDIFDKFSKIKINESNYEKII
jgi:hypothetical protein